MGEGRFDVSRHVIGRDPGVNSWEAGTIGRA